MKLEEDVKWSAKDIKNRLKAKIIKPERLEIIIEDEALEIISRRCIDDKYFDEIKNIIKEEIGDDYHA
jgi:hypothetical protein